MNFLDNLSEPWTIEEARDLVFGTVSDAFFESSYHQTWLVGDVFGWFPLPINSTCSEVAIRAAADEAAANSGTDLSGYSRLVYVFPHIACFWSGLATVGGNPSRAFINGRFQVDVVGHELGHGLGLLHSNALDCGSVALAENCDLRPYGDYLDIMGNRTPGHFNAFQKERLGWLGFGSSPGLDVVDLDGSYALEPYEIEPAAAPAGAKILRYVDPATGRGNWLYLEYRQALNFDDFLAGNTNVLNGVVVHKAVEGDPYSSQLLDLTPESMPSDFNDPALAVGESLFDAASGVTVTTDWADSNGAVVTVNFGAPVCGPADPEVAIAPAESQWVAPGTSVLFTITLTSHDNVACAATAFDLDALVPPGWLAAPADPSVTLPPGASATTTLEIVSPLAASDGFYDITVTAANRDDPAYAASATAAYVVDSSVVNAPPLAADDAVATVQETAVVVDVLANDVDPEGAPLQVTAATDGSKRRRHHQCRCYRHLRPGRQVQGHGRLPVHGVRRPQLRRSDSDCRGGEANRGQGQAALKLAPGSCKVVGMQPEKEERRSGAPPPSRRPPG